MIKGLIYHRRWFVPNFVAARLFDYAAHDRLPLWQLFFAPRSFRSFAKGLWWNCSTWTLDRLPWFARKHAINALVGRELLRDFRALNHDHPNFDLCIKW